MTKPRYQDGCAAGSQARGLASSTPYANNPDYAWGVNFNNGNSNINHRNNNGFVRAVRSVLPASPSEFQNAQDQVNLRALYDAWRSARRQKKASCNQIHFESCWMDRLLELQERLNAGTWSPSPTACFIAQRPKAREIHAPDFADRVVHHWLVPQLERSCEPGFIHDSYSNRAGKGTHAAVQRLQAFIRQVHSGQGGGWYLQLDIRNFFNSVHRPTLYTALKRHMIRCGIPLPAQHAVHALLRQAPTKAGVVHYSSHAERACVPPHKRLENAAPGCGLPIGNLSSQFFANVYLDALDQFIKHQLKAQRYLRYVDDFVLVHQDRQQLLAWKAEIARFLRDRLRLELKADVRLKPLTAGIDFLGYVIYPTHALPRPRVLHHAREALQAWAAEHMRGDVLRATPAAFRQAVSIWGSYQGHLSHARGWRAQERLRHRFPWLRAIEAPRSFDYRLEGRVVEIPIMEAG